MNINYRILQKVNINHKKSKLNLKILIYLNYKEIPFRALIFLHLLNLWFTFEADLFCYFVGKWLNLLLLIQFFNLFLLYLSIHHYLLVIISNQINLLIILNCHKIQHHFVQQAYAMLIIVSILLFHVYALRNILELSKAMTI